MCPVLAGPGLLDLREHPRVCGGHNGTGGLHHPQILHPAGKTHPSGQFQLDKIYCYFGFFLGLRMRFYCLRCPLTGCS